MQRAVNPRQGHIERTFEEVADPMEIVAILAQLATMDAPVFATEAGTGDTFMSRIDVGEARCGSLAIIEVTGRGQHGPYETGTRFEMFAAAGDADLFFEGLLLEAHGQQAGSYRLGMPELVCRIKRRAGPRGRSFSSWALRLGRKGSREGRGVRARLRDISIDGVGLLLQDESKGSVEVGAVFDDCLLLVRVMPIAACTLEIAHVREDVKRRQTIAGGRFLNLDGLARSRIEKLVAAARSEDAPGP